MQTNNSLWVHGWALGGFCFDPLLKIATSETPQSKPLLYDRGFFGKASNTQATAKTEAKIIVTHSLGLHWLSEEQIQNAEELIILAGFLSFHPEPIRLSQKVVKRMLAQLQADPANLLKDFYKNLFVPEKPQIQVPASPNVEKLKQELEFLNDSTITAERFAKVPRILIMHGTEDKIVPLQKAEELHQQIPQSELKIQVGQGHGFFMTHPKSTWQAIQEWKISE